jgi:hypothetical protein
VLNAVTPLPTVVERPGRPRRKIHGELAWLLRRGDSFLYLTDNRLDAEEVLSKLAPFAKRRRPVDIMRVTGEIDDDFIFESLWFGRASFIVDSAARTEQLLARLAELLERRIASRARVRQTAHIVWDLKIPIPDTTRDTLTKLAQATGLSIFICHDSPPHP